MFFWDVPLPTSAIACPGTLNPPVDRLSGHLIPQSEVPVARLSRFAILAVTLLFTCASFATTYYIAANGSDSNNGTSKTTPWQHAPGMSACSANCAAVTPQPGDQFILRGGDVWHAATSPVSLGMTWPWSGAASNQIYVGVDKTWFSGSSWKRPVFNGDNATSTSSLGSCAHNANGAMVWLKSVNYVIFDNFEFTGMCWQGVPGFGQAAYIGFQGNNITISNNYFHGWTHTTNDGGMAMQGATQSNLGQGNQLVGNIVDGFDTDARSLYAVYGDCYDVHNSTFRNVANGPVCNNMHAFHDNLVENINNSFDPTMHSNAFLFNGEWAGNNSVYNNLVRHTQSAVNVWTTLSGGFSDYYYNNVFYDISGGSSGNYWVLSQGSGSAYFYNNTFQTGTAAVVRICCPGFTGTANFINNQFITDAGTGQGSVISNESGAAVTFTANVFNTNASATTQGYTATNNYTPTSGNGSTVAAGNNLINACGSAGVALCSDTTAGGTSQADSRPTSGAWDAGAYLYTGAIQRPNPPTGLSVVVK